MNITQYIDQGFSIALGIAILWTVIFSMTNKPSIRGYRNLGLLACYILLVIYLFVIGWRSALFTWFVFGVFGGILYTLWEVIQYLKTKEDEKPGVSLSHVIFGQFAWPVLIPEAIEYILSEIGVLKSPPEEKVAEQVAASDR